MKFALFQALRVMDDVRHDDPQIVKRRHKKMEKQKICPRVDIRKKVDLFSHLPQYQIGGGLLSSDWEAGKLAQLLFPLLPVPSACLLCDAN